MDPSQGVKLNVNPAQWLKGQAELFDKIVEERRFDEKTARFYFQQLVEGVLYCHTQGVCHRDLKVSFRWSALEYS